MSITCRAAAVSVLTAVVSSSPLARADSISYNVDIFAGRLQESHSTNDMHSQATERTYGVHGTYYFSPVETAGIVLQELSFLRRESTLQVFAERYSHEFKYSYQPPLGESYNVVNRFGINSGGVSGHYFASENLFLGGGYSRTSMENDDGVVGLSGGYYYSDTAAVNVALEHALSGDLTFVQIGNHAVSSLGGEKSLAWGVSLDASVDALEETAFAHVDATYYFNNSTGLGAKVHYHIDRDDVAFQAMASHFFSPHLGLTLILIEPDKELNDVQLMLTARF